MLRSCPEYHADIPEILLTFYFFPLSGPNAIFFIDPCLKKMVLTMFFKIDSFIECLYGAIG